jgi:ubiquinone/menaquinone biosynthesis C-methylase UbiE
MKDYKQIWDNLSTNFQSAGDAVCFTTEEEDIRHNGTITTEFLRSVLQIQPTDKVLEIGCGIARVGRELAPFCGEWHGVDISGNMICYAKERTAGQGNVFLQELPEVNLNIFPDNTFDCVYSTIVFMHLDKPDVYTYLCEAQRVLKPGGRAYFDTFNILAPEAWQIFLNLVRAFSSGNRPGHMSQFSTPEEVRKYMTEAGFADIHIDDQNLQLVVMLGRKPQ